MRKDNNGIRIIKRIDKYAILVLIAAIFMSIGYAKIADQELIVSADAETEVQDEVFITSATTTNTNSSVNFFIGTMLDSTTVLSSSGSTVSYQVTMRNNADRDYVFIGALTDGTDNTLYSNPNIEYTLSGITKGVTTIAPNGNLTFTITFKYKTGASTSNNTLNSKINFRFKPAPTMELSNDGETYTLDKIYPGYSKEYTFNVKNYNTADTNIVPMQYYFETAIDGPLTAEIYNSNGSKVTGKVTLPGDGSKAEHTYKLKISWDSSKTGTEYEGKEYSCEVALKANPTDTKYLDYTMEKGFNVDITTNNTPKITAVNVSDITATTAKITATASDSDGDSLQYTLYVNDSKVSGPSATKTWDISELSAHKTYTYKVVVTDGKTEAEQSGSFETLNTAPTVTSVSASNVKTTTATVTAVGNDVDGDTLTYTLAINNTTLTSTNGTFSVTGLKASTKYDYTVTVSDGRTTGTKTGSLTTNTAPTLSITANKTSPTNATSVTYTFTFSENVTGFTTDDITVSNGTKGTFSGSGASYTLVVNTSANQNNTQKVSVAAGVCTDSAGDTNSAASKEIVIDRVVPTLAVSAPTGTSTSSPTYTTSSSYTVSGTASDSGSNISSVTVKVNSGTASGATISSDSWSKSVTLTANTTNTITVVATDGAGNTTTATRYVYYDNTKPTVTITASPNGTSSSPTNASSITYTFAFSEKVTGFAVGDVSVSNGSKASSFASTSEDGKTYTLVVTNSGTCTQTVSVAADKCTDIAGNGNTASSTKSVVIDRTKPTVTITASPDGTSSSPTNASSITYTFAFSEKVTGFAVGDVSVSNGSKASSFASTSEDGKTYTLVVTNSGTCTQTVSVAADKCTDVAGNNNTSGSKSVVIDRTKPTVTITASPNGTSSSPTNASSITYTFAFSEKVTGFAVGDVSVSNGSKASSFASTSTDGKTYTLVVTNSASTNHTQTVSVAADKCTDIAGNGNTAGSKSVILNRAPTVTVATSNLTASGVTITATGSDSDGDTLNYTLYINGTKTSGPSTTKTWDISDLSAHTKYTYKVVVEDAYAQGEKSGEFTTLNTAPTVTSVSASNVKTTTATVTAVGSDADGDTLTYTLAINNTTLTSNTGVFSVTGLKASTKYDYTVTVSDGITTGTKTGSLTTNTAPTLSITANKTSPTNATSVTYTFTFSESVTGFTTDDVTVTNGTKSTFSGSGASYTLVVNTSANQNNTQKVSVAAGVCTDSAGDVNSAASKEIVIDRVVPTLAVSAPTGTSSSSPTYTTSSSYTVSGTASDTGTGLSSVTVNGTAVTVNASTGAWSRSLSLTANTTTTVTVVATDKAGNTTTSTKYVYYDSANPSLAVSAPTGTSSSSPTYVASSSYTVSGTASDTGSGVSSVKVNGTAVTVNASTGAWSTSLTLTANTATEVKVVATDKAGRTSTATRYVYYDSAKPTISVSPASATACKSKSVTITATDSGSGLSSSNSYQYYLSTSSTALSGGSWTDYTSGTAFTLGSGKTGTYYLFVKTVSDKVSNVSNTNGTITAVSSTNYHRFGSYVFDNTAPTLSSISVTSPAAGTYKAGQVVTIVATYSENIYGNASKAAVTSSTAPTLKIKFGSSTERTATFSSVSGKTITYTYTIASGDNGTLATTSYSGTVYDVAGNSLSVANKTISGNSIVADTTAPTLSSISATTAAGNYNAGDVITIVATYSENIYGSASKAAVTSSTAPTLKIKFGSSTERTATFSSVSGTKITYTYTIASGDNGTLATTGYSGTVYDVAGNSLSVANKTISGNTIVADTVAPSTPTYSAFYASDSSKSYTSGTWTNEQVNTTISSTDATSGVSYMQYSTDKSTWSTFGFSVSGGISQSGTTYSGTEPWGLRDRNQTYYFRAVDKAGNVSEISAAYNIRYDITAPDTPTYTAYYTADNSSYTSGSWTNKEVRTIISAVDALSGVQNIQYSSDKSSWTNLGLGVSGGITQSGTTYSGIENWSLRNRDNTYYFRVVDKAGNASSASIAYNIKYDTTVPTLAVTAPTGTSTSSPTYTTSSSYTVSGTASDTGGSTLSSVTVKVNTGTASAATVSSGSWSKSVTLTANTTNTITVVATDGAGNTTTATRYIYYDSTNPSLAVSAPAGTSTSSPTYTTSSSYTVSGTASDSQSGLSSVKVNGTAVTVSSGSWSTSLTLTANTTTTVTVVATDKAGRTTTVTRYVYYDDTNPTLAVSAPTGSSSSPTYTSSSSYTVSGTASDSQSGLASVTVNGSAATVSNGSWSKAITLTADTKTTVTVVATDKAGRTTTVTKYVYYDSKAPTLAVSAPTGTSTSSPTYTTSSSYTVSGTVSDAGSGVSSVTVKVNSGTASAATVSNGSWSKSVTLTANTTNTITVVATDGVGRTTTLTRYIYYDNTNPSLAVSAPTGTSTSSPTYTTSSSYTVSGTASDSQSGLSSVKVNGTAVTVSSGSWSTSLTLTANTTTTVTVVATDKAGRTTTVTRYVYYDNTNPSLAVSAPTGTSSSSPTYTTSSSYTVSGTASDSQSGLSSVKVNGTAVTVSSGSWSTSLTLTANTATKVTVVATDKAGRTTTVTRYVYYDSTQPSVTITANPDGTSSSPTNASSITYTFTFSENVTGFTKDDISVSNGTKGTFSGSGKSYTLVVTNSASTTHTQTVSVAAGKCTDAAGNSNTAGSKSVTLNRAPTVTVATSSITSTGVKITATGSDSDGDTLNYTLYINGSKTNGPSTTKTWTLSNLSPNTTYTYKVVVADSYSQGEKSGSFKTTAAPCTDITVCYGDECDYCDGSGIRNGDRYSWVNSGGSSCDDCGWSSSSDRVGLGSCEDCGGSTLMHYYERGFEYYDEENDISVTIPSSDWYPCPASPGTCYCGILCAHIDDHYCSEHDEYGVHYYCDTHGYVGTSSTCPQ